MPKYLVFVFISLGISCSAQITALKLGSDVWPPFTNVHGEPALANELVKEALNRNKVAVNERSMDFDMVLKAIKTSAIDGSGAMWKSPEREEMLYFSEPYLQNQLVLVSRKESGLKVGSLQDVAGHKLAIVDSYAYGDEIDHLENVEFIRGAGDQSNFLKLLKGDVDYILVDELLVQYLMQAQPAKFREHLVVSEKPVQIKSLHLAIRKDIEGALELLDLFNASAKEMLKDGTYNRILKLNWIQADIDGDGKLELIGNAGSAGTERPSDGYSVNRNDSSQYPVASGNTYYINGKVYTNWDDVPADFKQGPGGDQNNETFNFLRFNF